MLSNFDCKISVLYILENLNFLMVYIFYNINIAFYSFHTTCQFLLETKILYACILVLDLYRSSSCQIHDHTLRIERDITYVHILFYCHIHITHYKFQFVFLLYLYSNVIISIQLFLIVSICTFICLSILPTVFPICRPSWIVALGAADQTRTGTMSPSRDFKSLVSTYSTTAACGCERLDSNQRSPAYEAGEIGHFSTPQYWAVLVLPRTHPVGWIILRDGFSECNHRQSPPLDYLNVVHNTKFIMSFLRMLFVGGV